MDDHATRDRADLASGIVVDAAIFIHSRYGPGLVESAYKAFLAHELRLRGLTVRTEVDIPVTYRGVKVELGLRLDMLVEEALIVELKTVSALAPIHHAQLLSYLRLSGHRIGLLLNFHAVRLRDGLRRLVNDEPWDPPA
ncbi:MAG TPA: GxxExxY protein [Gemmatimonadaceae bacterium]|nr:GxxExxY protein [Gemmatimonadaceae bacterium]